MLLILVVLVSFDLQLILCFQQNANAFLRPSAPTTSTASTATKTIDTLLRRSTFSRLSIKKNNNNDHDDDDGDGDEKDYINPNDLETPQERKRRMEMVRQVQKSFYGATTTEQTQQQQLQLQRTTTISKKGTSNLLLEKVPLWRVQWTELPGYQNLLNCHVPHYTHMFHTILSGPKPWYFGHVFLPGGSDNLDNPDYRLLGNDNATQSKATYTGVLMQVADARQLEDGRLALVVQALERFQIIEATQHEPYAIATVKLLLDAELAVPFYKHAQTMAHELSADFLNDNHAWGAACAAAYETAQHFRDFEYRPATVNSSIMGAVSPLANYNADINLTQIFPSNADGAESHRQRILQAMEDHLFSSTPESVPDNLNNLDIPHVIQLEHDVWVGVDKLVKLLHQLNPNPNEARLTPVPTQMLGLLPRDNSSCQQESNEGYSIPWPNDFQLDQYANRLEDYAATASVTVGTYSKSPFVRCDYADSALTSYPILRRAQRLSFVVWILLENIGIVGDDADDTASRPLSRQEILELPTITERLQAAKNRLDSINDALHAIAD